MVIDFKNMETKTIENFMGGKKEIKANIFNDVNNKILFGHIEPGASIGLHRHTTSSEIIFILLGEATIIYDEIIEKVSEGMAHYCPLGHEHSLINNSLKPITFLAIVPNQEILVAK